MSFGPGVRIVRVFSALPAASKLQLFCYREDRRACRSALGVLTMACGLRSQTECTVDGTTLENLALPLSEVGSHLPVRQAWTAWQDTSVGRGFEIELLAPAAHPESTLSSRSTVPTDR